MAGSCATDTSPNAGVFGRSVGRSLADTAVSARANLSAAAKGASVIRCRAHAGERSFRGDVFDPAPGLRKTLRTWYSTVLGLMKSCEAISLFVCP
jgi:hypothetical protein